MDSASAQHAPTSVTDKDARRIARDARRIASQGGPSLKASYQAADLIRVRSLVLLSPEMRTHLNRSRALHWLANKAFEMNSAAAPSRRSRYVLYLDFIVERTDGLFTRMELDRLSADWPRIRPLLDESPDYAGIFAGVGLSEAAVSHQGAHRARARGPQLLEVVARAIRFRLGGMSIAEADEAAAAEFRITADWTVREYRKRVRDMRT